MRSCKLKFYLDKEKKHRWTFKGKNGRIISDSSQGYKRKSKCRHGFEVMADAIRNEKFEIIEVE